MGEQFQPARAHYGSSVINNGAKIGLWGERQLSEVFRQADTAKWADSGSQPFSWCRQLLEKVEQFTGAGWLVGAPPRHLAVRVPALIVL
ncbi:unnamed protein product [Nippostrongylus brasiliensis]|uniref:Transposase n=1 Tax=Nippostrongylus brasiliensis TaxID=27835 RepID=A0A0N4Y2V8_NIPBR|nr:unnamed protein product [Nippostrongylus brasiliensis]